MLKSEAGLVAQSDPLTAAILGVSTMAKSKVTRTCCVSGCSSNVFCRDYCGKHYNRLKRTGTLERETVSAEDAQRYLESLWEAPTRAECIEWPYGQGTNGYGSARVNGEKMGAHRAALMVRSSPIDNRMQSAHNCGNRRCVNPDHLRWATPRENASDRLKHGTDMRGSKASRSRLTETDVLEIRASSAVQRVLAQKYGVSRSAVSAIQRRKNWSHLPESTEVLRNAKL